MPLSKLELRDRFVSSLAEAGAIVSFVGDPSDHPFSIAVSAADTQRLFRVYIWRITHGGGQNRPGNEYRIQITGVPSIIPSDAFETLILGFYEADQIFAGWDVDLHSGPVSSSPSLQVKWDALQAANLSGFGFSQKGNQEIAVAFAAREALSYALSNRLLHAIGAAAETKIIRQVAQQHDLPTIGQVQSLPVERQRATYLLGKLTRDSSFSRRVFAAYAGKCAFCGTQMRIVDAAHLIPVANPASTDETSNGICLCGTHHRSLDRGLITLSDTAELLLNTSYIERRKAEAQSDGLDKFIEALRHQSLLPPSPADRPSIDVLRTARAVRNLAEDELVPVRLYA